MERVLITGATGMVGSRLIQAITSCIVGEQCITLGQRQTPRRVLITTRSPDSARSRFGDTVDAIDWNPAVDSLLLKEHEPISAVVNLMGESVSEGRWTKEKKQRIRDSRVVGTGRLVDAIGNLAELPEVVVSASAVGYYGDCGMGMVNEQTASGSGFLPDVCRAWEQATLPLSGMGIRRVTIRIGIVLARDGGALSRLLPIFRTGLAGRLGNGQQYFPWIHIDDLVALILWALRTPSAEGVYNATAPNPETNCEFTSQLAKAVNRPAIIPVPKFAVRSLLGEFADSLFDSQRVVPEAALRDGFEFRFPRLADALHDLLQ